MHRESQKAFIASDKALNNGTTFFNLVLTEVFAVGVISRPRQVSFLNITGNPNPVSLTTENTNSCICVFINPWIRFLSFVQLVQFNVTYDMTLIQCTLCWIQVVYIWQNASYLCREKQQTEMLSVSINGRHRWHRELRLSSPFIQRNYV